MAEAVDEEKLRAIVATLVRRAVEKATIVGRMTAGPGGRPG